MLPLELATLLIDFHRRRGDAALCRYLNGFAVGEEERAASELASGGALPAKRSAELTEQLFNRGAGVITILNPAYPCCLRALERKAPPILYTLGNLQLLSRPSVAVIGTRRPCALGRRAAREYTEQLAARGCLIVSGNVFGVDAAAHAASLDAEGNTLVFAPSPLDTFIPSFRGIDYQRTLVVSVFAPGTPIAPYMFLQRNSAVAAHCRCAFVAETGSRGGTLDTIKKLRELARPTYITQFPEEHDRAKAHDSLAASGLTRVSLEVDQAVLIEMTKHTSRPHRPYQTAVLPDLFPMEIPADD